MADIYLALLHYPVYDKGHKVVTTSITNMDIHDIARSARTYNLAPSVRAPIMQGLLRGLPVPRLRCYRLRIWLRSHARSRTKPKHSAT